MARVADPRAEVPLTLDEPPPRVLGALDQGAFWANLGVSLLGFAFALFMIDPLGGGTPLSVPAAITAAVVGSLVGTTMVGLAAIPGAQTGRPAMVLLRGLFGAKLSYVPTVLNIVQMLGWGAFELWVIARGAQAVFGEAVPYPVWVIGAGTLTVLLTIYPLGAIRLIRRVVTVGVVVSVAWFALLLTRDAPQVTGGWDAFMPAVDFVIALSISYVPVAADFARHSRSSGAAFGGAVIGYSLAQVATLLIGVYAVAIAGHPAVLADSTAVFAPFVAAPMGALFFGILVLRETDQAFANNYSTTMSLQNLMPKADRRLLSAVVAALTVGVALVVDVNSYGAFLSIIGAVFVPMFAVLAVDYFLLGGRARWNTAADAPSRWRMVPPWVLGFATWWMLAAPPQVAWWAAIWDGARAAIGFTPPPWSSAALGAFLVAALVTWLTGLGSRR